MIKALRLLATCSLSEYILWLNDRSHCSWTRTSIWSYKVLTTTTKPSYLHHLITVEPPPPPAALTLHHLTLTHLLFSKCFTLSLEPAHFFTSSLRQPHSIFYFSLFSSASVILNTFVASPLSSFITSSLSLPAYNLFFSQIIPSVVSFFSHLDWLHGFLTASGTSEIVRFCFFFSFAIIFQERL